MNSINNKTNRFIQLLPFILFFLLGTFYLLYFTNYILFYQEKVSLFILSFAYLQEHLNQPGGFLIYLGELQTTFYYYPFIGALLVSLEICGVIILIQRIGKVLSGRTYYFIPFFIGAVFFYLQTNYQYTAFNNLGILIQLVLFHRIVRFSKNKYLWIPVFLSPSFYFLFGSFSILILIPFILFLIQKNEWLKLIVVVVLTGIFFFIGKEFLFFQTTETLIQYPFSVQNIGGQIKLFAAVIGVIGILPLFLKVNFKKVYTSSIKNIKLIELTPFIIIVVLALVVVPRIDKKNSHYFHVEKLFYEHKYDEIIAFNQKFPSTNKLTNFLNNIALSETGKLNDALFRFPQSPDGGTLFLKWEMMGEVLRRGGYFYYEVGMINEAHRWAYEYMVMRGLTPEILKMLIKTELINGNFNVAKKYIHILNQSLFYRRDAREFEKLLYNESAIDKHPELGTKKRMKTRQDFFVLSDDPAANLDKIIEADSTNHVVLEYKFALLMLQKDIKQIAKELPKLEKCGYTRIPKNIEEALVSYKLLNVGRMPELERLKINPQTEQRFSTYYNIFQENSTNKTQAQRALSLDFADTFWYYVFFY